MIAQNIGFAIIAAVMIIAAVRVVMKAFPGQIEQAVLQRANPIVKEMQFRVQALDELR